MVDIIGDFPHTLHPTIYISCSPTLIFLFFHFWFMHLLFTSESNHCSINFFQKRSASQMAILFSFKKKREGKCEKLHPITFYLFKELSSGCPPEDFLVNLQVIAVAYAIMTTRSVELDWKMRTFRVLPMFLLPAFSSIAYSAFVSITRMCK